MWKKEKLEIFHSYTHFLCKLDHFDGVYLTIGHKLQEFKKQRKQIIFNIMLCEIFNQIILQIQRSTQKCMGQYIYRYYVLCRSGGRDEPRFYLARICLAMFLAICLAMMPCNVLSTILLTRKNKVSHISQAGQCEGFLETRVHFAKCFPLKSIRNNDLKASGTMAVSAERDGSEC